MVTPYQQQVDLRQAVGTQLRPQATPDAFGAEIGRGMQSLAQGGFSVARALAAKEAVKAEADARAAYNKFLEADREITLNPEAGYLNQTGANAVGARKTYEERLEEARQAAARDLSPAAQREFERLSEGRINQRRDQAIVHESAQLRDYTVGQYEASIASALQDAGLTPDDAVASERGLAEAIDGINRLAALQGWSPEERQSKIAAATSQAVSARVVGMAYDDPIRANALLEESRDRLAPAEYARLREGIRPAYLQAQARADVTSALTGRPAASVPGSPENMASAPRLVAVGKQVLGMNETQQRDALMAFMRGGGQNVDPAVTAWCAAFVNAVLGRAGIAGTGSLAARSFVTWGQDATANPSTGDIVVFPRGSDPSKGHVGILVGFNERGDYLILGGNQGRGGAVSVQAYPRDKAIAVRRAAGGDPDSANLPTDDAAIAGAFQQIMAISDTDQRNAALRELELRISTAATVQAREQRATAEDAWRQIAVDGVDPTDLPMEMQLALGPEGMSSLISASRSYRIGTDVTDETRYAELLDMAYSTDPAVRKQFAETNLFVTDPENLSRADMRSLAEMQRTMILEEEQRASGAMSDQVYDSAAMAAELDRATLQFTNVTGINIGATTSGADRRRFDQFRQQLRSMLVEYANETGQPMPESAFNRAVGQLLLPVAIGGEGVLSMSRSGNVFDLPFRAQGEGFEMDITSDMVPLAERERVAATLQQAWGRPATTQEVMEQYEREVLLDLGLRPEITFDDIPTDVQDNLMDTYPDASEEELIDLFLQYMVERPQPGE